METSRKLQSQLQYLKGDERVDAGKRDFFSRPVFAAKDFAVSASSAFRRIGNGVMGNGIAHTKNQLSPFAIISASNELRKRGAGGRGWFLGR